jgi:hypothetical protein
MDSTNPIHAITRKPLSTIPSQVDASLPTAQSLPVQPLLLAPSAFAAPKRLNSSFYPIVLYITSAAKPSISENISYQFGAMTSCKDAIVEMRKLSAALCASRAWEWKENFDDKDVLWCYLWKGKDEKGGEERKLMGWWVAERVWIRKQGRNVSAEMEEFVAEHLCG